MPELQKRIEDVIYQLSAARAQLLQTQLTHETRAALHNIETALGICGDLDIKEE